jgi:hypothetical protein
MTDHLHRFELSLETQQLERLLRDVVIGDVVTYSALSAAIGRDVQHDARHFLTSARRRLLRDPWRLVFRAVPNIGLERLDDAGKIGRGRWHLRRARSQASKAIVTTKAVDDFTALPRELQTQHHVNLAQAGALRYLTSEAVTTRIVAAVTDPRPQLSLQQSLRALSEFL